MKKKQSKFHGYTKSKVSLSTVVDKKTMDEIYKNLDNAPMGTASLNQILKEIERERAT